MDSDKKKEVEIFKILWHEQVKDDLEHVSNHEINSIATHVNHILSSYPYLQGEQVKGKNSTIRRIKHASYRIIFTVVDKEVWILGIEHRKEVYRTDNVEALIRLAIIIRNTRKKYLPGTSDI